MLPALYFDHAATTPVRSEVLEAMLPYFGARFGNPSSAHRWGREARVALDEARERVARCLGARSDEICFTSGGTEADNFAILGGFRAMRRTGRRAIVATATEHKAVLAAVEAAAAEGAEERLAPVASDGTIDLAALEPLVDDSVALLSVMWVNNEIGTIQPIERCAALAKAKGALFHTDAIQALGKVAIDVRAVPVDFLAISGHKVGAPKGIGALFIRRGVPVAPLLHGGSQNRGRRPGTENVAFAVGLARACELAVAERETEEIRLRGLRDLLERLLVDQIPDAVIHGSAASRAAHVTNVAVPGTDSESLLMALDLAGIAASAGSACQAGAAGVSHVLMALGIPVDLAAAAIRLSLGPLTTREGVERVAEIFPALVSKTRRLSGVAG